jgi:hypothetical protein
VLVKSVPLGIFVILEKGLNLVRHLLVNVFAEQARYYTDTPKGQRRQSGGSAPWEKHISPGL